MTTRAATKLTDQNAEKVARGLAAALLSQVSRRMYVILLFY
jgi:hypothetical protein